jgi:catechol 2,3-dioxygenase-like lactoylglutathione lyase family enzyme
MLSRHQRVRSLSGRCRRCIIYAFLLDNDELGGYTHDGQHKMLNLKGQPRVTSFAPQFLVDDLVRSMTYYQKLGFTFGEPWDGFYVIGELDGLELHLKEARKNAAERQLRREHEHLDAAAGVDGIEAFYDRCLANGATILRPLTATAWGTKDFYIEDPDGHIIAFGGRPSAHGASQEPPCL